VSPARVDLRFVPFKPGLANHNLMVEGQGVREAYISVPDGAGPFPLVVFLHGAGGGDAKRMLECLVEPALRPLSPIILGPRSQGGEWWTENDTAIVLGLTEAAARAWPVQNNHVVIAGYSNGGIGTWFFARRYPHSFSAAIPIASDHSIAGESSIPVYAIHGDRDELFGIADVRERMSQLEALGLDVRLHEKSRGSHFDPCSYLPELESAGRWLTQRVWRETKAM
jgi:predicted esterase